MSEHERFSVPHEIDEILERLPPQVTLNVPDHILSLWFPPGPSTASWKEQRSRALKATRKAVHADSHITAASVKGSSISRYRRTTDPAKSRVGLADGRLQPNVIINNVGEPETGARKLVDTVYATGVLAG